MIKKDCSRCDGDGGWYTSDHHWYECPRCGGSGKVTMSAGEMAEGMVAQLAKDSIKWMISNPVS